VRRAKKLSFNAALWRTEHRDRAAADVQQRGEWTVGKFQDCVSARTVASEDREYGYLRLWSFDLADDDGFVEEVRTLLSQLPQEGLIVDVRGNPGGSIQAAERLLQLFTPGHVEPTRFSLVATDLTRAMSDAPQNRRLLGPWRRSLDDARSTGDLYSQGVPITPVERCNDIG
jgi:Peptidase family S41